jgi:putative intracellular protease/amidase
MHRFVIPTMVPLLLGAAVLQLGCGEESPRADEKPLNPPADPWRPGDIEDARAAPEEKIAGYEPRFGRTRPLIAVLAQNLGVELADYVTPYGVLAQADVADVLSVSTEPGVVNMRPLQVEAELTIDEFDRGHPEGADYVIVPAVRDGKDPKLLGWISAQAGKGSTIVSICLGALAVANTGLMDGRRVTSHWGSELARAMQFPNVRWQKNTRWVADGRIVSSAGISAAVPVSMALVEAIAGHTRAAAVAEQLGVKEWSSKHESDAFQLRPGEAPPSMEPFMATSSVGIPVREGIDEISLALTADAYMHARQAAVYAVADALLPISTLSGLRVLPERTSTGADRVDRVLASPEVKPATHALDVALRAIEAEYGRPASCMAARTMEHPSYGMCP